MNQRLKLNGYMLGPPNVLMQLKVGRQFAFGEHRLTASLNIFNLLNSGANTQNAEGANQQYNPAYLSGIQRLSARAFQLMVVYRF